jgi:hypothetical protein
MQYESSETMQSWMVDTITYKSWHMSNTAFNKNMEDQTEKNGYISVLITSLENNDWNPSERDWRTAMQLTLSHVINTLHSKQVQ